MLAASGCNVVMVERHPVLQLLLHDALRRLKTQKPLLFSRLSLLPMDSCSSLSSADHSADVVYIDPMYPAEKVGRKSLVKKETQILHHLLGHCEGSDDTNNARLLATALTIATERVVVKRPLRSENLAGAHPHSSLVGSTHRFDCYMKSQKIKYAAKGNIL